MSSKVLRRAFFDICNGYSSGKYRGDFIYIKHLSHKEHLDLDELEDHFFKDAKANNISTEEEKLKYVDQIGLWTDKMERDLAQQKSYVLRMVENKKSIPLPSMLKVHMDQIKVEEVKLAKMQKQKREAIGLTCENYASRKVNEYYIVKYIYKDSNMLIPYFSEEDYQDMDDDQLDELVQCYENITEPCSEQNVKKLAIQDFYQAYYYLCQDNFYEFFDRPISKLTYFQLKLANHSKYFKNLFESNDTKNLPENVKNDPDLLISYLDTINKGKSVMDNAKGQNIAMVGASKEDVKILGGTDASKMFSKPMNAQEMLKARNG